MSSNDTTKGAAFEQEIEQLLSLKGYSLSRNELLNGTQIDLVARRNDLLDNLCFVVECSDRQTPVGVDLLKQKAAVLLSLVDSRYLFRLIFITRNGFTAEAKAYARAQANILLLTAEELESQLIDFAPYVNWYLYNYEHSSGMFKEGNLYGYYVELTARDERYNIVPSLTEETERWLKQNSNNLLFVLGEYGSGKTSFCRQFVYKLLDEKYRQNHQQRFIPIIINLREHRSGSPNLQQVITDTLVNRYGVRLPSFMAFEHVCSSGRVLLVLDGFDEMTDKSDRQTLIDCFNQIYLLASLNAKVILTCRSNFFHSHSDIIDLLKHFWVNLPVADQSSEKVAHLSFENHGRILSVEKFNEVQIRQFIAKRFGAAAESILAEIQAIHDLSDLSTRPVLLDMIVTTLPQLAKTRKRINSAALYEYYTNRWTARDDWRVKVPLNIRRVFCEILGWVMHNANIQEIDYLLLERMMIRSLHQMAESEDQLEKFKNDIQTCSFLVRVGGQNQFRFAHKSFLEYFVARKIVTDLSEGMMIEKPTPEEWETKKTPPKDYVPEHAGRWLGWSSIWEHGIYLRPLGSSFASFYDVLSDRLRETDAYLTLAHRDISSKSPAFRSESAVKTHFEEQIRAIVSEHTLLDQVQKFGISEEIATFAVECLENVNVKLDDLLKKLHDQALTLLGDILRLGKSTEFVRKNEKLMKQYVRGGEDEHLKISFCAALAKLPDLINLDFVVASRAALKPHGWSYFLFELASSADYREIFKQIFEQEELETLDKVICVHGMRDTLPQANGTLITESLVLDLLSSNNAKNHLLAVALCQSVRLPEDTAIRIMAQIMAQTTSNELKEQVVLILGSMEGKKAWQVTRGLWAKEKDPDLRDKLKQAEQDIRNAESRRRDRISWDNAMVNRAIRDKMWHALRAT
jgi:hypothetical protein